MLEFTIQEHDADRAGHHYDFRLEDGNTMKSWVLRYLPSGKGEKRLAIKVPDHPTKWADFEGEIKEGYGKGTIRIYDSGGYEILYDGDGYYKLYLAGEILVGNFCLRHTNDNKWLMWYSNK